MARICWTECMSKMVLALVAGCVAASCSSTTSSMSSSTKLVKSWRDPSTTISSSQIHKILFIAIIKDKAYSRMMEDHLVAMSNGKGIASNALVTSSPITENDRAVLDQKIKSDGIDLVVIMRLKDVKEEPRYVPNTESYGGYAGGYWGYYYYAAPIYSTPGFYTTQKHYLVETNVYSTADSKLLWSGITDNVNPDYATTERIAKAVVGGMKKEGLLLE